MDYGKMHFDSIDMFAVQLLTRQVLLLLSIIIKRGREHSCKDSHHSPPMHLAIVATYRIDTILIL
jgi:hypothetical protein